MSTECPRCVRFDPLLDASICSQLLTNGTTCGADYTLCPETPLETSAAPTGDDAASDGFDWVEVGSAASGSTTEGSGCSGCVAVPDAAATPLAPRTESTARPPKSATATDAVPTPSEAASRHTGSSESPSVMLPPWLIITLAVVVAIAAALLVAALYMQRAERSNPTRGEDTPPPPPPPLSSVGDDLDSNGGAKDQFSPNSYGFGYELSSMRSNDVRVVSSRSNVSGDSSSPSSSRNDTNESAVPTSFAHRMDATRDHAPATHSFPATRTVLGLSRAAVQSLPPLQPRSRTPGWTSSPPSPPPPPRSSSTSTQSRFAQYSFPRFTGDARVTMPSIAAVSRSWSTNEFELMDDTSSNASASCDDDVDDVFLTDNSSASAFADCDYVDAQTPGQVSSTGAPRLADHRDAVDIYLDTSTTTLTETGRMFSPLSMRTRDTAAFKGDVVAEWASLRGDTATPEVKREQQQHEKLAQWKAKFYQEL